MDAKLTLKLNKSVIEGAKTVARHQKTSLSRLIENYLRSLIQDPDPETSISPLVEELTGILSVEDLDQDAGYQYLMEKHR